MYSLALRQEDAPSACDSPQPGLKLESTNPSSPRVPNEECFSQVPRLRAHVTTEKTSCISEEYMAMTKACIHDHDYYAVQPREISLSREPDCVVAKEPNVLAVEMSRSVIEVKPEIHRANIRVRQRRIVRKSAMNNKIETKTITPFSPSVPKKEPKQTSHTRDCDEALKFSVPSPRPSITPFPPVEKNSRRICEVKSERTEEPSGAQCSLDNSFISNTSADSAYNSLTFSSTSQPQFSSSRPPSGGKRSATDGISSSSSSDFSCDECSDAERRTQNTLLLARREEGCCDQTEVVENVKSEQQEKDPVTVRSRQVTRSGRKIRKHLQRSDTTPLNQDQKKMQYLPAPPPPKPKKGRNFKSVPMRLRALPTSFWEEPNQTNGTTYTILPPVTPLLHQHEESDISEISPTSSISDKPPRAMTSSTNCDRAVYHPIIKAGDTDLLLRLFDHVETANRSTAVRKKRGRCKRPEYVAMPSRRPNNQNPCIIDSITEKLFPKLSLDNRQTLAALTRTLPRRTPVEITGQDVKLSNAGTGMINTDDLIRNHHDEDVLLAGISPIAETRTLSDSSPILVERPSRILPQLTPHKDYSQLLTELTAVL